MGILTIKLLSIYHHLPTFTPQITNWPNFVGKVTTTYNNNIHQTMASTGFWGCWVGILGQPDAIDHIAVPIVILGDLSIFPNVEYQWISWIISGLWKPVDSEEKKRQPSPNWELLDFCAHRSPPGWVKWIERKILSANDNNSLTRKVWLYWVIPSTNHYSSEVAVTSLYSLPMFTHVYPEYSVCKWVSLRIV